MAKVTLGIGVVAVLLALLPLSAATQVVGLLLGVTAALIGYWIRGQRAKRGEPTAAATVAMTCGLIAVVLGGLVFASCQACSGDGEVDPKLEQQFRETLDKALDKARQAGGSE